METPCSSLSAPPHVSLRHRLLEFLLHSSMQLHLSPIVKYTALSFFADRFLPSLHRETMSGVEKRGLGNHWLLNSLMESNLQLFALISIWVSSKIHDTRPVSVKRLKGLGDKSISDQHFTARDFVEAEMVLLEVLEFDIGASCIAFVFLEDLLIQFRELSKLGELLSFHVCMEIMDLLYETEVSSMLFSSPCSLAASVLVAAYILTVPKQQWEFPILPWVNFVTSYGEENIAEIIQIILEHILKIETKDYQTRELSNSENWNRIPF